MELPFSAMAGQLVISGFRKLWSRSIRTPRRRPGQSLPVAMCVQQLEQRILLSSTVVIDFEDGVDTGYSERGAGWSAASGGSDDSSRRGVNPQGGETQFALWQPGLPAGWYDVEVFNVQDENNTDHAQFTVVAADGAHPTELNQQTTPTGWIDIGTYRFDDTGSNFVQLVNVNTNVGSAIRADAVRFTETRTRIIDQGDAAYGESGVWEPEGAPNDGVNDGPEKEVLKGFRMLGARSSEEVGASATWTFDAFTSTLPGRYSVEFFNPEQAGNTQTARVTVNSDHGSESRTIDPNATTAGWYSVGTYTFDGSNDFIQITNLEPAPTVPPKPADTGRLFVDAVRITRSAVQYADADEGSNNSVARWTTPELPSPGKYRLEFENTVVAGGTDSAEFAIHDTGGTSDPITIPTEIDQRTGRSGWVDLGEFDFGHEPTHITLTNQSSGTLQAGRLRWVGEDGVVQRTLDLLRRTQLHLRDGEPDDGAIRVFDGGELPPIGNDAEGSLATVRQYFADFGAQALLASGDVSSVGEWLGWLADRQTTDGFWYDYDGHFEANGQVTLDEVLDENGEKTVDAWDSSAAQFAVTLDQFQAAGGVVNNETATKLLAAAENSFEELQELNRRKGLGVTVALPNVEFPEREAEFLLDNVEVYAGLRSLENIFRRAGNDEWAEMAGQQARELKVGLDLYWQGANEADVFSWARFNGSEAFSTLDGTQNPDAFANLAGVAWVRPEQAAFDEIVERFPWADGSVSAANGSERYYMAARRLDPDHRAEAADWRARLVEDAHLFESGTYVQRLGLTILALEKGPDYFPNVIRDLADTVHVVDNGQAGYSEFGGGWTDSALTGSDGSSTRYSSDIGAGATWRPPEDLDAGWYRVELFNVQHPTSATNTEVTVVHAGATQSLAFNQQTTANGYTTIGTFYFDGNGSEAVTLRKLGGSGVVRADAVRFQATHSPSGAVIENGTSEYAEAGGGWTNSGLAGSNGSSTRFSASPNAAATWSPQGLAAGWYTVDLFNVNHPNSTTNARVTIVHGGATQTRLLDQKNTPSGFVKLGTFYFGGGDGQSITLENLGGGNLRADTVRLRSTPPPAPGTIDNGQPGYSEFGGGWANSGLTGSSGSSTRFSSNAGAGASWRPPSNLAAGWYTLDLYNVQHPSNTTNARVTIKHAGNTVTQFVNQRTAPNGFRPLGTFYFDGSGTEAVTIQNLASGALRADALRFRATTPPGPFTVDNGQPGHSEFGGGWANSGLTGSNGSSTRFTTVAGAGATWRPAGVVPGFYVVEVYNVQSASNTTNARVTISQNGNTTTRTLDQRNSPNGFVSFGTFFFDGSGSEAITLQNLGGLLRADAVRLRSTQPPQAQTQQAAPGAIANSSAPSLTQGDLDSLIDDALAAWAAVGVDPSAFDDVRFAIGDLAGNTLGTYASGLVTIDTNAAGHGWFVDATPEDDAEFTGGGPAGFDLFTVLKHELGHHLGLADETDNDGSLLETMLDVGERRHVTSTETDLLANRDLVDDLLYGV